MSYASMKPRRGVEPLFPRYRLGVLPLDDPGVNVGGRWRYCPSRLLRVREALCF